MNMISKINQHQYYIRSLKYAVILIVLAMGAVEFANSIRLWTDPYNEKSFPYNYVSQGIYSFGGYIRPPDNFNVDIAPILKASVRMLQGDVNQYRDFQIAGPNNFYPPSAAFLFTPFGLIVNACAGDLSLATQTIDILWRLCVLIILILAVWLMRPLISTRKQAAVAFLMFACFYPMRWMLVCLQAQSLVTLLLVFAIITYARGVTLKSGILIGIAACIKPHFALIIFFAVFRKEWRFLFGMFLSSSCVLLGSLFMTGFSPWLTYLTEVIPTISRGYAFYPNQSLNGIVHRWLGHNVKYAFSPMTTAISISNTVAAFVFSLAAVCPRFFKIKKTQRCGEDVSLSSSVIHTKTVLRALDLGIAILCFVMAAPIVWEHHFAWTVVLFALCLQCGQTVRYSGVFISGLALSYFLLGTFFMPVKQASSGITSLINAPIFFGALLLISLLWYCMVRIEKTCFPAHGAPVVTSCNT